ncbi:hypothetical protein Dpep_1099 [Dethiosulfovibrio peptidovorans DSM 11002]|uniref:Uncharacterized protein n=1 Tax=Dethiosulfovibrio peptidovorans DSM 11002 TaxID=469381 RepID=D2Z6M8_9BACT|nr:hypothetical protein Dpep_1099 [Dethiosulfovibrio peptidovorans DSM 11002]
MSAFNFVVAYLILSACVLWRKEILQKYRTIRQNAHQN